MTADNAGLELVGITRRVRQRLQRCSLYQDSVSQPVWQQFAALTWL